MTDAERWLMERRPDVLTGKPWNSLDILQEWDGRFGAAGILDELTVRDQFVATFGFAILTRETIETLRQFEPILEVGSGSGYWSYELQQAGIDCIATDSHTGNYNVSNERHWPWKKKYTEVERLTATQAVRKYPGRTLLMVWPDYEVTWAYRALRAYTGKTVIYVGEGDGGCTADDKFHQYLDCEFEERAVSIPKFWGIRDYLGIWTRKTAAKRETESADVRFPETGRKITLRETET
jgi:hypothetical protein